MESFVGRGDLGSRAFYTGNFTQPSPQKAQKHLNSHLTPSFHKLGRQYKDPFDK